MSFSGPVMAQRYSFFSSSFPWYLLHPDFLHVCKRAGGTFRGCMFPHLCLAGRGKNLPPSSSPRSDTSSFPKVSRNFSLGSLVQIGSYVLNQALWPGVGGGPGGWNLLAGLDPQSPVLCVWSRLSSPRAHGLRKGHDASPV